MTVTYLCREISDNSISPLVNVKGAMVLYSRIPNIALWTISNIFNHVNESVLKAKIDDPCIWLSLYPFHLYQMLIPKTINTLKLKSHTYSISKEVFFFFLLSVSMCTVNCSQCCFEVRNQIVY